MGKARGSKAPEGGDIRAAVMAHAAHGCASAATTTHHATGGE